MKERIITFLIKIGLFQKKSVYYIGGTDVLPPPLKGLEAAQQLLIERNLRLVVFISRRFENTGINLEDLISIGTIGLIKAINTYK